MMWLWMVVLLVFGALAYVRLAPVDVAKVHRAVTGGQDRDGRGSCLRVMAEDTATFARIDAALRALPRTQVLAGSLNEGRITYVTRSRFFGLPDYTTVEAAEGQIKVFARLRFGRKDMGVNRARVRQVLKAAEVA